MNENLARGVEYDTSLPLVRFGILLEASRGVPKITHFVLKTKTVRCHGPTQRQLVSSLIYTIHQSLNKNAESFPDGEPPRSNAIDIFSTLTSTGFMVHLQASMRTILEETSDVSSAPSLRRKGPA